MLIAGEASGDSLAAELVAALKESPQAAAMPFPPEFFGAGGPQMAAAGVEVAIRLTQHAVIGLPDALRKYSQFKRIFDRLFRLALEREPDVIICVDFSGFNRRFARAIKRRVRSRHGPFLNWDPKIVQYVSPQVWASRPGRAQQLERDLDLLLSIFPFEQEWYARRAPKLRVQFVGHPIVERFAQESARSSRDASGAPGKSQILLLPGSRVAELRWHLPVLLAAARLVRAAKPDCRFRMILPGEDLQRAVSGAVTDVENLEVRVGGLAEALAAADLAITKSGTIALECAFFGVPAVVFYKSWWPTYLSARMIVGVEHLAMPNLLAKEEVYPEFIQHKATPGNLARAALDLLNDAGRRKSVQGKLARVVQSLGEPGASKRAAKAVLRLLPR
jgi:lipid-A-disaccharide synthase